MDGVGGVGGMGCGDGQASCGRGAARLPYLEGCSEAVQAVRRWAKELTAVQRRALELKVRAARNTPQVQGSGLSTPLRRRHPGTDHRNSQPASV